MYPRSELREMTAAGSAANWPPDFKAGDYDQTVGTNGSIGAKVQFYALSVLHGP